MAAAKGNNYAVNKGRFKSALLRAMARKAGDVRSGLDRLAAVLIDRAEEGEGWALAMIMDRIDGKPEQPIRGQIEHNHTVVAENGDTLREELDRLLHSRAAAEPAARSVQ